MNGPYRSAEFDEGTPIPSHLFQVTWDDTFVYYILADNTIQALQIFHRVTDHRKLTRRGLEIKCLGALHQDNNSLFYTRVTIGMAGAPEYLPQPWE